MLLPLTLESDIFVSQTTTSWLRHEVCHSDSFGLSDLYVGCPYRLKKSDMIVDETLDILFFRKNNTV